MGKRRRNDAPASGTADAATAVKQAKTAAKGDVGTAKPTKKKMSQKKAKAPAPAPASDAGSADEDEDEDEDEDAAGGASKHPRVVRNEEQKKRALAKSKGKAAAADEAADEGATQTSTEVIDKPRAAQSPRWINRQRTLVFSSRGVSYRARHLMDDLRALMPHSKKDVKIDRKDRLSETVPEICEMKNCNNCIYFEMRKKQDLYMWLGKMPHGPCVKFLVQNVHTMDELKMSGNGLKGSRPMLNFEAAFDTEPELRLLKELLFQAFGTPRSHPKSKPFVDRVMSFFWLDGRIWVRNFQVKWSEDKKTPDDHDLAEIGPRFVLQPIRIFQGAFGGKTLYENDEYISPNEFRREVKNSKAQKYLDRVTEKKHTASKTITNQLPEDETEDVWKQAEEATK